MVRFLKDPNSFANTDEVVITHFHLNLTVDFKEQILKGYVDHTLKALKDNVEKVILDARTLEIGSVFLLNKQQQEDTELERKLGQTEKDTCSAFGSPLIINFHKPLCMNQVVTVRVYYKTTSQSAAIQFLRPEQTQGKKHPYLFSQCQAIHARSLVPCQDTPSVKQTYSACITVPKPLVCLMSALREVKQNEQDEYYTSNVYYFKQPTAIPSYLLAIAVGDLKEKEIGPRSSVWCEQESLEEAAFEFSETDDFLQAGEEITGVKYAWGRYDLLLLPPSFPYGGMENPCLTFLTPTLLAGDRSLANVVAHEAAHSWFGNYVTSQTWEHFWMNEGFTVFLERKMVALVHEKQNKQKGQTCPSGKAVADLQAALGAQSLKETISRFHKDGECNACRLVPQLLNVDPDDVFSTVPYEKGFQFLCYLESLVDNKDNQINPTERSLFSQFLNAYVKKYFNSVVNSYDFQQFFLDFFAHSVKKDKLAEIEWDRWYTDTSMPLVAPKFDDSLIKQAHEIGNGLIHILVDGTNVAQTKEQLAAALNALTSNQKVICLEHIQNEFEERKQQSADKFASLCVFINEQCHFATVKNCEVRFRFLLLCLVCGCFAFLKETKQMMIGQGRMKFTRPLYRACYAADGEAREMALTTFKEHQGFYHSICAIMIAKDLKVA